MEDAQASSGGRGTAAGPTQYVRFLILSDARTGSNMLVQALNSSPYITCFREPFNRPAGFIDFNVDGYDRDSAEDRELRDRDCAAFLRERIFCRHPAQVRAVGFKVAYSHFFGFQDLEHLLAADSEIRVLHLRRRNLLRSLVSLKIANATGAWLDDRGREHRRAGIVRAARQALRAAVRLRTLLPPRSPAPTAPPARVRVSADELFRFIVRVNQTAARFDDLFRSHPSLTLTYEDMVERRDELFGQVQAFLGVDALPLTVTLRRQNPQPLRELIENYDDLHEAYRDSPHAGMFD